MKIQFFAVILLAVWTLAEPQDAKTPSEAKPGKGRISLITLIKDTSPKIIKRSPGTYPFASSLVAPRIFNQNPINLMQNGPYYINHYFYYDEQNFDQKQAELFSNLNQNQQFDINQLKPLLQSADSNGFQTKTFVGDKEFHVVHLPKDKDIDLGDIQLHFELLDAHKSPNEPHIDLDLNRNFDNFEVNLEGVKPLNADTFFLDTASKSSANDIVKPLIQGHIPTGFNQKYQNLVRLTENLNQNIQSDKLLIPDQYSSPESNKKGEILDLPHFEKHPLEDDSSKSSYDTPGAVDSYGDPATSSYKTLNSYTNFNPGRIQGSNGHLSLPHVTPSEPFRTEYLSNGFQNIGNKLNSGFENRWKGNDLYQAEEYANVFYDVNGLQRKRSLGEYKSSSNPDNAKNEKSQNNDEIRHSNHKYD